MKRALSFFRLVPISLKKYSNTTCEPFSWRGTSCRCHLMEIRMKRDRWYFRQLAPAALIATAGASDAYSQDAPMPVKTERVAETTPSSTSFELRGTSWRWVEFTSPTESLTVLKPDRYTLAFTDYDRVALRADCNRGQAQLTSPARGELRIGPVAMTKALCPPNSLSDRFTQEVARVVRYAVRGGELYLELANGSGTMRFIK
jgi:heat shock protein HslJ